MKALKRIGIVFVALGAITVLVTSGAINVLSADRSANIGTTDDENALLAVDKPDELILENASFTCTEYGGFWNLFCQDGRFEYEDERLGTIADHSDNGDLELEAESIEIHDTDDQYPSLEGVSIEENADGFVINGTLHCDARNVRGGRLSGPKGDQRGSSTTVVIAVHTNGDIVAVDLERELQITCLDEG